jgi:hypothetical protein
VQKFSGNTNESGFYLIYSVVDRDENTFREIKRYLPDGGRWVMIITTTSG